MAGFRRDGHIYVFVYVERLKEYNTFNLSIKNKYYGLYRITIIQFTS